MEDERSWIAGSPRARSIRSGKSCSSGWSNEECAPPNGLKAVVRDGGGGLGQAVELVYGSSVIDQRCIFHKLKNVSQACRKELKGDKHKEERKLLLQQASAVYQAESAQQAKERLVAWAAQWRQKAPKSVATLEGEFEATIAYFQLEGLPREWVRTTSLLERVNRQLLGISSSSSELWKPQRGRGGSVSSNSTASCSMD